MRFYLLLLVFFSSFAFAAWPWAGLMYNDETDQKIAIGVFPQGHLNVGSPLNITSNASATGLAYKFPDGNWKDATSPGCLCEGWSAGATSSRDGRQYHGDASVHNGGIQNITVKSFIVDPTSIESVVTIKNDSAGRDRPGQDMLEVKHVYSPSKLATDELFEVNVTLTNVSGNTLSTVRYNRTMDWDIPPTEFREVVTIVGAEESARSPTKPRVYASGNNGFRDPNVFGPKRTGWSGYSYWPHTGVNKNGHRMGPQDHGFSATFEFDDLLCGQSHTFKTYYGAAASRELMIAAFVKEGVPLYSIGEQRGRTGVVYGFGFKGVSGTALAPTLPEKSAVLPGGIKTDEDIVQTYAPPLIQKIDGTRYAFQAVFNYRKDHQWEGDILRYTLDGNGDFIPGTLPLRAADILEAKINDGNYEKSYAEGGRNIWTVGQASDCPKDSSTSYVMSASKYGRDAKGTLSILGARSPWGSYPEEKVGGQTLLDQNNFITANKTTLERFIYNCGTGDDEEDIIKFVRGYDAWNEDGPGGAKGPGNMRKSLIGDTFHSNLVYVGPPSDSTSSTNIKSEAYFRKEHDYQSFKDAYKNREARIYVGANDGMLHAFDKDLNLRWSFIPPQVLSKLRGLKGADPDGITNGTSNTKFLVDGPMIVKDVYDEAYMHWKTILIGSLGWGGKGYYMLDISDHRNPLFLGAIENDDKNNRVLSWNEAGWRRIHQYGTGTSTMNPGHYYYPYQHLGFTWSKPSISLLPFGGKSAVPFSRGGGQKYALVFGAGYAGGATVNQGNYVIVADATRDTWTREAPDGFSYHGVPAFKALAWDKIPKDAASDANKGVTAAMSIITPDKMSATESDYYGGIAYFPDLNGQLWKYNLTRKTLPTTGTYSSGRYQVSSTCTTKEDSCNDDDTMFQLNKMWRSETTVANDRYGSHQVASTLIDNASGKNVYHFFGTGDQSHIQTRYSTIDNWVIGAKDIDFPDTTLALTGTDKTKSSPGIFRRELRPSGTTCSSTDVPGWYAKLSDRYGTVNPARVTGRIMIKDSDLYVPIYTPENTACPAYGTAEIMIMKNGCGGSVSGILAGTGLSTSVVADADGNLYIGLSNKKDDDDDSTGAAKRVDNILKIGEASGSSPSTPAATPGIRIKSWRELFN